MAGLPRTHLTLSVVFTEVLVVGHHLVLVVDANQGVSSCQLLVKFLLRRDEPDLRYLETTLLAIRSLERCGALIDQGRARFGPVPDPALVSRTICSLISCCMAARFPLDDACQWTTFRIEVLLCVRHVFLAS